MDDATEMVGGGLLPVRDQAPVTPPETPAEPPQAPQPDPEAARLAAMEEALGRFAGVDWQGWSAADPASAARAFADYRRLAGERDAAVRAAEAERELARDIEGWSPELRAEIAAFAGASGFTPEEIAAVEDPRAVKVLHLAMRAAQGLAGSGLAAPAARVPAFTQPPPTQVGGQGFAGHLPNDRLGADAWMAARRAQLRKKA